MYKVLVQRAKAKRLLGKHRRIWEIILKENLKKQGGCGLDWFGRGYDPMVCPCEHGNDPSCSIKHGD
jgi:hypothetical protein